MTDIVERLLLNENEPLMCREAADEIKQLRMTLTEMMASGHIANSTTSSPKCPYCAGKGVDAYAYLCPQCSGTGQTGPFVMTPEYVENYRRIRVRIMMDIAEQLREYAHHWHKDECPTRKGNYCTCGYEGEAGLRFLRGAEEIDRLREALKRKQETR